MSNHVTKTLTVELNSGKSFDIEVTAIGAYDSNYGADADGNRGMAQWTIEQFEFDLPKEDEDTNVLTLDELHELDIAIHKEALKEEWEFSQEDDREYEPEMEDA